MSYLPEETRADEMPEHFREPAPGRPYPLADWPESRPYSTGSLAMAEGRAVHRRRRRGKGRVALLAAALVVVLAGAGLIGYTLRVTVFKDSGVAMCEQIRDAEATGNSIKPGEASGGQFTRDEYHRIRKHFADSRHDDLREAGTKLIDLAWQLHQAGDNTLGMVLAMGSAIMSAYSSLVGACANHGVDIDSRPAAS